MLRSVAYIILLGLSTPPCFAQNKFKEYTYLGGIFRDYEFRLLKLALSKTAGEYGDFVLLDSPDMSEARGLRSLFDDEYPHGIRITTVSREHFKKQNIRPITFPLYLGLLGYRVCFVNEGAKEKLKTTLTEASIKKLVHVQGHGWRDVEVLRENGFLVTEGNKTQNLYKMLAAHRVDLFCRGTNEIRPEEAISSQYKNISLDASIAFFYPLPFFAYTNALDDETSTRIHKGLIKAYEDGSLLALWQEFFGTSVAEAALEKRKIFQLTNPHLKGIETSFMQYIYQPDKLEKKPVTINHLTPSEHVAKQH